MPEDPNIDALRKVEEEIADEQRSERAEDAKEDAADAKLREQYEHEGSGTPAAPAPEPEQHPAPLDDSALREAASGGNPIHDPDDDGSDDRLRDAKHPGDTVDLPEYYPC